MLAGTEEGFILVSTLSEDISEGVMLSIESVRLALLGAAAAAECTMVPEICMRTFRVIGGFASWRSLERCLSLGFHVVVTGCLVTLRRQHNSDRGAGKGREGTP